MKIEMKVSDDCKSVITDKGTMSMRGVMVPLSELGRTDEQAVVNGVVDVWPIFYEDGWTPEELDQATKLWIETVRPLSEVAKARGLAPATGRVYVSKHDIPSIRIGKVNWVNRDLRWTKT